MSYEEVHNFYSQIKENFGDHGIWFVLFVIMLYDNNNHKFPDYLKEYPQTKEIVEFLEQDELFLQTFIKAAKESNSKGFGGEINDAPPEIIDGIERNTEKLFRAYQEAYNNRIKHIKEEIERLRNELEK